MNARQAFRPRLSISTNSGFCAGAQWALVCNAKGGQAGGGCVRCTSVAEALADYWWVLKRVDYPLLRRDGTIYRPSELREGVAGA